MLRSTISAFMRVFDGMRVRSLKGGRMSSDAQRPPKPATGSVRTPS
jgi:hypothetical protein